MLVNASSLPARGDDSEERRAESQPTRWTRGHATADRAVRKNRKSPTYQVTNRARRSRYDAQVCWRPRGVLQLPVKADTERAESAGVVMPFVSELAAHASSGSVPPWQPHAKTAGFFFLALAHWNRRKGQKPGTERHTLAHTGTLANEKRRAVEEQFGQQAQAAGNSTMKRARPARPWPNNTSRVAHTVAHTGTLARWPSMRS